MEEKLNYKKTELGMIPQEWNLIPLKELTNKIGDGLHGTPIYSENGNYFFVNGNNLDNGKLLIKSQTKKVDHSEYIKYKKPLNDRSILMSVNGTIGNLAFFKNEKIVLGKSAAYLNIKKEVSKSYIYHALKSKIVKKQLFNGLTGSTIDNLGLDAIRRTKIPLPPNKVEQKAIENILSDADFFLSSLNRLILKKSNFKKAISQKLLTGQIRLPGFSKEWKLKKLGDLLTYEQPTQYIVNSSVYNKANKVPVLTAGKTFILGYTNEKNNIYCNLPVIIFDDFTCATKYVSFPFKVKSSAMKLLKTNDSSINLKFVYEMLQLVDFQVSEHKRHWISEFQKIKIKLPIDEKEQFAIASILSDIDMEISSLEHRRNKSYLLKQAMMQELLTGKIRLV